MAAHIKFTIIAFIIALVSIHTCLVYITWLIIAALGALCLVDHCSIGSTVCLVDHCRSEEIMGALCAWLIIAGVKKYWEHCVPG